MRVEKYPAIRNFYRDITVPCIHPSCNFSGDYFTMLRHIIYECAHRKLNCPGCGADFLALEMIDHLGTTCPTPRLFCASCRTIYPQHAPHNCVKELTKKLLELKAYLRENESIPPEVTNFMQSESCPYDFYLPVPVKTPLFDYVKEAGMAPQLFA